MDIKTISAIGSPKSYMIYHEDPQQLHINTLSKHCYFVPFAINQNPFADREKSDRFELLNGDWDFRYYDSIIDLMFFILCGQLYRVVHRGGFPPYLHREKMD